MNIIALIILLSVRMLLPFGVLVTFGEWIRRREKRYWLHL